MRPIDADALLEQYGLKDATKYGNENAEQQHKSYSTLMMYEIADMIYDAPTSSPAANWTPCSVALPEAGKQVLVTAQWGDEEPEVFSADMNPITDAWEHSDGEEISRAYTVLAWQPLPESYRGEA